MAPDSGGAYAEDLDEKLTFLLDRSKAGTYHAPPVRRAYIPKEGGTATRPIGVPTFEYASVDQPELIEPER
jgi:RNA-directed DNA polymerase